MKKVGQQITQLQEKRQKLSMEYEEAKKAVDQDADVQKHLQFSGEKSKSLERE